MQHSNRQHHIRPATARQVLLALACGAATREARAKIERLYGPNGQRVADAICEREA